MVQYSVAYRMMVPAVSFIFLNVQCWLKVKQSWISTIWTSLLSSWDCFLLILKIQPSLIICNGPGINSVQSNTLGNFIKLHISWRLFHFQRVGTCVLICYIAWILHIISKIIPCSRSLSRLKIVFVESFCRVKSLSLSGRLLYPIADAFIVQWPQLTQRYPKAKYLGVICWNITSWQKLITYCTCMLWLQTHAMIVSVSGLRLFHARA